MSQNLDQIPKSCEYDFTQYPVYTVLAFDEWRLTNGGILVAYFIISSSSEIALKPVLQALKDKALFVKHDWEPSLMIVDNAQAELNVLE